MAFNPNNHLTDLRGKQYLEVAWRLVWFRIMTARNEIAVALRRIENL